MGRPCRVCLRRDRAEIDATLLAGASDYAVARQYGIERTGVGRHRRAHLLKVAQNQIAILAKDTAERQQRQELAEAAASDEPSPQAQIEARFGAAGMLKTLVGIAERLERVASKAEQDGAAAAVAQVSNVQVRAAESGARLAGVPAFVPPRVLQNGATNLPVFSVVINMGEKTETINMISPPVIDGVTHEDNNFGSGRRRSTTAGSASDYEPDDQPDC